MISISIFLLKAYARYFPIEKGKRRIIQKFVGRIGGEKNLVANLKLNNLKLNCDISKYMQQQIFFLGVYEEEDCRWWVEKSKKASVIFDVGSNIGIYSLLAASSNTDSAVHAFEPTPWLSKSIDDNVKLNSLNNITNNRVAVSDKNGEMFLNFCGGSGGNNEGMNFVTETPRAEGGEATQGITLDTYCEQNNIKSIDLMKIDVEGGEFAVLSGAKNLLENRSIRCIMLELLEWAANRSGYSTVDIKKMLVKNGYEIYVLEEGKQKPLDVEGTEYNGNIVAFAQS